MARKVKGFVMESRAVKVRSHPQVFGQAEPAGVGVETTPLAPPAFKVFTPDELDWRLTVYGLRAAAKLPLFPAA